MRIRYTLLVNEQHFLVEVLVEAAPGQATDTGERGEKKRGDCYEYRTHAEAEREVRDKRLHGGGLLRLTRANAHGADRDFTRARARVSGARVLG